jgi:hypothetical protein
MTASTSTPTLSPTTAGIDPTAGFRRVTSAIALPLGFAFQLASNVAYGVATLGGGSDSDGASALDLYGRQPGLLTFATFAAIIGVWIIVAGAPAALRVLRRTTPRLALVATILLVVGYIGYLGGVGTNFLTVTLAASGLDAAAAMDTASNTSMLLLGLPFVIGNLLGAILLGIAVLRSGAVPRVAGALILGWPVLHITGLFAGTEWFAVAGGVLQIIGLSIVARGALRLSNAEWAARG